MIWETLWMLALGLPVSATRQSDGEQGAQGDRNAPHELHAFLLPHSAPPPGGGHGGLSGDTRQGDKPDIRGTPLCVLVLHTRRAFLRGSVGERCSHA